MRVQREANRLVIDFEARDAPALDQLNVLLEAVQIYTERNEKYKDNWRRFGWRGCLFRVRERVERAWDYLWDAPVRTLAGQEPLDTDDLIDLINFAAITVRAVRENNRDGSWW